MTGDDPFKGRKDLMGYEAVPFDTENYKLIPFERIKYDDQVKIICITQYDTRLYVGTDKGLYVLDGEVLKPVILQDN